MDKTMLDALALFHAEMTCKLNVRVSSKGGAENWRKTSLSKLLAGLEYEIQELKEALDLRFVTDPDMSKRDITGECADVANYAMMISDVVRNVDEPTT